MSPSDSGPSGSHSVPSRYRENGDQEVLVNGVWRLFRPGALAEDRRRQRHSWLLNAAVRSLTHSAEEIERMWRMVERRTPDASGPFDEGIRDSVLATLHQLFERGDLSSADLARAEAFVRNVTA